MGWKGKFIPQARVNDHAVVIDAYGETTWDITESTVAQAREAARDGSDWDYLRDDDNAPFWVREYPGPFEVELISPSGDAITASDVESGSA